MEQILYARETEKSYENFKATCPHCNHRNIYNRITDLKTTEAIDYAEVACFNETCNKSFAINGDLISPAFQMLIYDCYELKSQKHYAYCILNLAQAFEVFFSLYLQVQLIYKPLAIEEKTQSVDNIRLNELAKQLYDSIKNYAFIKLRNIFLNLLIENKTPITLDEAEKLILTLDSLTNIPSDQDLQKISDTRLLGLLQALKNSTIHEIRNRVVHKRAYRPTLDEVDSAIKETGDILFLLAHYLEIDSDDINHYVYKVKRQND